jgi:hypothetical protein
MVPVAKGSADYPSLQLTYCKKKVLEVDSSEVNLMPPTKYLLIQIKLCIIILLNPEITHGLNITKNDNLMCTATGGGSDAVLVGHLRNSD